MKKNDIYIILGVVIAAVTLFIIWFFAFSDAAATVEVTENNKSIYIGKLSKDKTLELSNNTVVIKNGVAYMKDADCKNHDCIMQGKIKKKGQTIICLPNKVTVEVH